MNLIADFPVTKKQLKPSERTCGYWMASNPNGTKKSGGVLALLQSTALVSFIAKLKALYKANDILKRC